MPPPSYSDGGDVHLDITHELAKMSIYPSDQILFVEPREVFVLTS